MLVECSPEREVISHAAPKKKCASASMLPYYHTTCNTNRTINDDWLYYIACYSHTKCCPGWPVVLTLLLSESVFVQLVVPNVVSLAWMPVDVGLVPTAVEEAKVSLVTTPAEVLAAVLVVALVEAKEKGGVVVESISVVKLLVRLLV